MARSAVAGGRSYRKAYVNSRSWDVAVDICALVYVRLLANTGLYEQHSSLFAAMRLAVYVHFY